MNRIILLILCLGIAYAGNSQDAKSDRKARKEARDAEMAMRYKEVGAALDSRRFVIEMEYLLNESGNSKKVNQMLNYIWIDSSKCSWQSDGTDINTDLFKKVSKVEGTVDGWKLAQETKQSRYFLQFKMFTDNGVYHVTASINSDKTASGTISGIRDNLTYSGRIVTHRGVRPR